MNSKTCLFCRGEKHEPAEDVDYVCSGCGTLLGAADQHELQLALDKAIQLGITEKALAINFFMDHAQTK